MAFWKRLFGSRKPDLSLVGEVEALAERLTALEEQEAARAAEWVDLKVQLRKILGRLDKHAGIENGGKESTGQDPKQLAAILRTKFPHAGG